MSNGNPPVSGAPSGPGEQPNTAFGCGQDAWGGYGTGPADHGWPLQGSSQSYGAYGEPEYGQPGQPYGAASTGTPYGAPPYAPPQYGVPPYGWPAAGGPYGRPQPPLASWGSRVAARLLDTVIPVLVTLLCTGFGLYWCLKDSHKAIRPDGTSELVGINGWGALLIPIGIAFAVLFAFWDLGVRQGKTGQSLGKKVMGIAVIDERTGQPAGMGAGVGRWAVEWAMGVVTSCVGFLSLLDVLWPLWDPKNQTLHDKAVHTLVVTVPTN